MAVADRIRRMSDEELEKELEEINQGLKTATGEEREHLLERLELADKAKKIRAEDKKTGRINPWIRKQKQTKEEAEKKTTKKEEKEARRKWNFIELLRPQPLPPIWRM
jgi:hypothetical protein